jgi:3-isopropylmalate/(R)-2-methylmalate dehydratase small subunit
MSIAPFRTLTSRTVVLPQGNIDTDQIIPARFLTTTARNGLGPFAFNDWRYDAHGNPKPDFVLNTIDPAEFRILVGGKNFGCGSSREHAPWALMDYGFRVVVSTEIADIFHSNSLKIGLLPLVVDQTMWEQLAEHPGREVTVDLENCEIRAGNHTATFQMEPFARRCLLDGVDPLGYLLQRLPQVEQYEKECAA